MKKISAGTKTPPSPAPPKTPRAFPVWQTALAQELGLTADEVRELRDQHLVKGADWDFDAHNHVAFTAEAAQKLAALAAEGTGDARPRLLGQLRQRAGLAPARALPAHVLKPTEVPMKVTRAGETISNHRIVQARLAAADGPRAAGTLVSVWVRDNAVFRREDALTGRWDRGLFYHLTSRPPRRVR